MALHPKRTAPFQDGNGRWRLPNGRFMKLGQALIGDAKDAAHPGDGKKSSKPRLAKAGEKLYQTDTGAKIGREEAGRIMFGDKGYEAKVAAKPSAAPDRPADLAGRLKAAHKPGDVTGSRALAAVPSGLSSAKGLTHLTKDQRDFLAQYRGTAYPNVNGALRRFNGDLPGGFGTEYVRESVGHLDAVMERSKLSSDVVVHRGVKDGRKVFGDAWDHNLTGAQWTEHAYLSTSADATAATNREFFTSDGGAVLRVRAPKGTGAAALSDDKYESEILLQRGLRMQVLSDTGPGPDRVIEVGIVHDHTGRPAARRAPGAGNGTAVDGLSGRAGMARPGEPGPAAPAGAVDTSPLPTDPAERARVRQARIDQARAVAQVAAEAEEIHGLSEGDSGLIARGVRQRARTIEHADPDLTHAGPIAADIAGQPNADAMLAAARRHASEAGLTRTGAAGEIETFDPALHKGLPGDRHRPGDKVSVVRPGYSYDPGDGQVVIEKAVVEEPPQPQPAVPQPRLAKAGGKLSGHAAKAPTAAEHRAALDRMQTREEAAAYLAKIKGADLRALAVEYNAQHHRTVAEQRAAIVESSVGFRLNSQAIRNGVAQAYGADEQARAVQRGHAARAAQAPAQRLAKAGANLASPGKAGTPKPATFQHPATADGVAAAVREMVAAQGADTNGYASITELRKRIGGSRQDQDQVLLQMARDGLIYLAPEDNQKTLTAADRAAAIDIGGEPKHVIRLRRR